MRMLVIMLAAVISNTLHAAPENSITTETDTLKKRAQEILK